MKNFNDSCVQYIEPTAAHTASVIVIHGMGDSGIAWKKLVLEFEWPTRLPHVRWVFPTAPQRDMTLVPGTRMSAWFDVLCMRDVAGSAHDEEGIHKSMNYLHSLIQSEIAAGIRPSRIVLGGFSQGGAIALRTGISLPFPIRGIFSLCGYLPNTPGVVKQAKEENLMSEGVRGNLKVFVGNGTNDPSVKFPWSEWSAQALKLLRFDVDFRSYLRAGHYMHPQISKDIVDWIDLRIPEDEEWADVMF